MIKPDLNTNPSNVTVILTVWKRNHLLEQLEALFNQTEKPDNIWVFQEKDYVDSKEIIKKFSNIEFIHSSIDSKYFGRFALAQFIKSKFTWILDDDVIPSTNWIANSRRICEVENAIISSSGRIIPQGDYMPERQQNAQTYFFGDVANVSYNLCLKDTVVDFGNNSWFFKSEWIKAFWQIPPYTLETGEDIHLSAVLKIKLGINTIVPEQVDKYICGNLKKSYGNDVFASWTKPGFLEPRAEIIKFLIEKQGWQPLLWLNSID